MVQVLSAHWQHSGAMTRAWYSCKALSPPGTFYLVVLSVA